MAGGKEGEGPRFEPTSQQPRQPDNPLQGRTERRESPPGPVTGDRSKPLQSQHEIVYYSTSGALENMRALYEEDPNLFATRTLEALVEFWQETIPDAEHVNDRKREAAHSFWETTGYTRESLLPHGRLIKAVSENAERRGYVRGLKDAFGDLYTRITENVTRRHLPLEGEPESQSQEEDRDS